ncbi:MAG: lipase family protein [Bacillota bacterium]
MNSFDAAMDPNEKVTLALAFLAYEESSQNLRKYLASLESLIGKYALVWGPSFHYNLVHKTDSMAFIVRSMDEPASFYVVIRGTTPLTLTDWIFHDLLVQSMVSWDLVPWEGVLPPPQPLAGSPAVSLASNNALAILVNVLTDNGITIGAFLQNQVKRATTPVTIYFTGHSLGGAMAPALALYLHDHWPAGQAKPLWKVYGFAGPTAGNGPFASHSNRFLGADCKIYQNPFDVATHVWDLRSMEKLPSLYAPLKMPNILLKILQKIAIPAIKDKNYTQLEVKQPEIPSRIIINQFIDDYLPEMIYQHLLPYFAELIRLCPETGREQLIQLIDSWEIIKTFKEIKPFVNCPGREFHYFLELLS